VSCVSATVKTMKIIHDTTDNDEAVVTEPLVSMNGA
jgi:hypothetical protein